MVAYYKIAGRQVASHWLSIAVLSVTAAGSWAMMGGKKAEGAQKGPPTNAKDQDEEKFIQEFIRAADQSDGAVGKEVKAKNG